MYKEHGTEIETTEEAIEAIRAFVKIVRAEGSLESVLQAATRHKLEVIELSLRPSLDKRFQFLHLSLEGSGQQRSDFGNLLCELPGVKCAEISRANK